MIRTNLALFMGGALAVSLLLGFSAPAQSAERPYGISEERERCSNYDPLRRPFFGDTHVHTTYSFDANGQDTRNTPRDAYRFAKGEKVGLQPYDATRAQPMRSARLRRPLDFAAVTDHAEMLGEIHICAEIPTCRAAGPIICWAYRLDPRSRCSPCLPMRNFAPPRALRALRRERRGLPRQQAGVVWREIQAAAEEAYDRSAACSFTSFVGYEWTATVGNGENLHRNVIFRNERVPAAAGQLGRDVRPPSICGRPSNGIVWASGRDVMPSRFRTIRTSRDRG